MLWPDQFTRGWPGVFYIERYRLASHKKDLAQILFGGSWPWEI